MSKKQEILDHLNILRFNNKVHQLRVIETLNPLPFNIIKELENKIKITSLIQEIKSND